MVQKPFPARAFCRRDAKASEKVTDLPHDGSKTSRRRRASSVTEDSAGTESTDSRRTRMKFTPVNPQENRLTPDSDKFDNASESGQAHDQLKAGLHCRASKTERGGDSFPLPASSRKRSPAIKNSPDDDEDDCIDDDDNVDTDDDGDDDADDLEHGETVLQRIRVDEFGRYYTSFFSSIGQYACKEVLKAWIIHCHPKKQSHHPYNGSKHDTNPDISWKEYGYPGHFTMPYYWASDIGWQIINGKHQGGVRHQGPDHLRREERLILLPHLLRWQGIPSEDIDFSVDNLEKSTKRWRKVAKKIRMQLKDLYEARRREIEFERGEIDGDFEVYLRMPTKKPRKSRRAAKPVAKTARPAPKSLRKRPEQTDSISPNSHIVIDMRIAGDSLDLVDNSKSNVLEGASSLAEDAREPMSCEVPHGMPFESRPNLPSHDINYFGPPSMRHDVRVPHRSPPPRPMVTRMERTYDPSFSSSSSGLAGWHAHDGWVNQPDLPMYPTIADPQISGPRVSVPQISDPRASNPWASHLSSTMGNGRFTSGYGDGTPSGLPQWFDPYTIGGHQMAIVPPHPGINVHEDRQYLGQQYQIPSSLQTFDSQRYGYQRQQPLPSSDYAQQQPPQSGIYQRQQPPPSGMDTPPPEDYLDTGTDSSFPGHSDPHTLSSTDYKMNPYFQGHHRQF